jgi:hypothetical protein
MAQTAPAAATSHSSQHRDAVPLDRKRLFMAFTLTPMLAGFYPAVFLGEPMVLPLGLILSYLSTALFGLPLVVFFNRRGVREWWMYLVGGAVCAVPTVVLYALAPLPDYLLPFGSKPVLALLFWGAASGLVFWMIGVAGESPVSLRTLFDPLEGKLPIVEPELRPSESTGRIGPVAAPAAHPEAEPPRH